MTGTRRFFFSKAEISGSWTSVRPMSSRPFSRQSRRKGSMVEGIAQTFVVGDDLLLEIDRHAIAFVRFHALEKLVDLIVREGDRQEAVLETIVVENIGVARRENRAESVIENGPRRMLAARSAAKIGARQKHASAFVSRLVQHEIRIRFFAGQVAPVVEQDSSVSLPCKELQKLLRHHLIGIDVHAINRRDQSSMFDEWFHQLFGSVRRRRSTCEYLRNDLRWRRLRP